MIQNVDKAEALKVNSVLECFWSVYAVSSCLKLPWILSNVPKVQFRYPQLHIDSFSIVGSSYIDCWWKESRPANLVCIKIHPGFRNKRIFVTPTFFGQQPESAGAICVSFREGSWKDILPDVKVMRLWFVPTSPWQHRTNHWFASAQLAQLRTKFQGGIC